MPFGRRRCIVRPGIRHVDVLVQLQLKTGASSLLLIHLEVQAGRVTASFSARMFQYHVRLLELHPGQDILSCAILLDGKTDSFTQTYQRQAAGCELIFRFPVINLAAWRHRMAELKAQASTNPFAVLVLAQLEYRATRSGTTRMAGKLNLARALAKWDYAPDTRRLLFLLMDSLLVLPDPLNDQFLQTLETEEPIMMNQINSYERFVLRREKAAGVEEGLKKGLKKGMRQGKIEGQHEGASTLLRTLLHHKFGAIPDWAATRIAEADAVVLQQWGLNILDAKRLEDVFRD